MKGFFDELRKTLGPALDERRTEEESVLQQMAEKGYTVYVLTTACPLQLYGYLPTGEPFYFRARGEVARLQLHIGGHEEEEETRARADAGDGFEFCDVYFPNWLDDPETVYFKRSFGNGNYYASWLSYAEAFETIEGFLREYYKGKVL